MRRWVALALAGMLAACAGRVVPPGEPGRAPGGHGVPGTGRLPGAAHAAIEVQLLEARAGIGGDHRLRAGHGVLRRQVLPRVRSQVVAAQDDPAARHADAVRDAVDELAEAVRRHAGVAAVLVDLVARRLDQGRAAVLHGLQQRRLDDHFMRRAYGHDAHSTRNATLGRKRDQGVRAHAPAPAMKASSSAKLDVPSIGPRTPTARAPLALA